MIPIQEMVEFSMKQSRQKMNDEEGIIVQEESGEGERMRMPCVAVIGWICLSCGRILAAEAERCVCGKARIDKAVGPSEVKTTDHRPRIWTMDDRPLTTDREEHDSGG